MAMFNSYVTNYQRVHHFSGTCSLASHSATEDVVRLRRSLGRGQNALLRAGEHSQRPTAWCGWQGHGRCADFSGRKERSTGGWKVIELGLTPKTGG